MSLTEDVKSVKAGSAPAKAPQAPAVGAKKGSKSSTAAGTFRATGAAERAKMTEDQRAAEGTKSAVLQFQNCIADPTQSRSRKTTSGYIKAPLIVGYCFTATEDIKRPVLPLKEGGSGHMDVVEQANWENVPAGTPMQLNIVESAMLLSQVEYAGQATGGEQSVFLYATSSGQDSQVTPALRAVDGSIKEKIQYIADVVGEGADRQVNLKPEYEAFRPLVTKKSIKRKGGSARGGKGEALKDTAAAFRKLYASMGGQA